MSVLEVSNVFGCCGVWVFKTLAQPGNHPRKPVRLKRCIFHSSQAGLPNVATRAYGPLEVRKPKPPVYWSGLRSWFVVAFGWVFVASGSKASMDVPAVLGSGYSRGFLSPKYSHDIPYAPCFSPFFFCEA